MCFACAILLVGLFGCDGGGTNTSQQSGDLSIESADEIVVKDAVNDYTWEELSKISAEISEASDEAGAIEIAKGYNLTKKDGQLDGSQTKSITLSDGTDVDVQIVGFLHDDKTSGGKAGITFIFENAISKHDMNSNGSNAGGWKDSQMRSWLSSGGMKMLPNDLRNALIEVDKKTNNVGKTDNISSISTTPDKLWLYSSVELFGKTDASHDSGMYDDILNAEGSQYKLYRDMDVKRVDKNDVLLKLLDGKMYGWWVRSSEPVNPNFYDVRNGYSLENNNPAISLTVVPGFCI